MPAIYHADLTHRALELTEFSEKMGLDYAIPHPGHLWQRWRMHAT